MNDSVEEDNQKAILDVLKLGSFSVIELSYNTGLHLTTVHILLNKMNCAPDPLIRRCDDTNNMWQLVKKENKPKVSSL